MPSTYRRDPKSFASSAVETSTSRSFGEKPSTRLNADSAPPARRDCSAPRRCWKLRRQVASFTDVRERPARDACLMDAIRTTGLTKRYGSTLALDNLDLAVGSGEVYGFLGPNG